jgi:hypothetical protein
MGSSYRIPRAAGDRLKRTCASWRSRPTGCPGNGMANSLATPSSRMGLQTALQHGRTDLPHRANWSAVARRPTSGSAPRDLMGSLSACGWRPFRKHPIPSAPATRPSFRGAAIRQCGSAPPSPSEKPTSPATLPGRRNCSAPASMSPYKARTRSSLPPWATGCGFSWACNGRSKGYLSPRWPNTSPDRSNKCWRGSAPVRPASIRPRCLPKPFRLRLRQWHSP